MYTVFLSGGIASGKSTVAAELVRLGATTIDLDQVSRRVLSPGSPTLDALCRTFGANLVDASTGELKRGILAQRAFASAEGARQLEAIEMPAITQEFLCELKAREAQGAQVCLVQIPLLDRVENLFSLADEIVCVVCPLETRRERAIGRGMTGADFDARVANQPSDAYFREHATTLFQNSGTPEELVGQVDTWWKGHEAQGWRKVSRS